MRKKQSEGERRWEVQESEEERMGKGRGRGKGGICCGLAVALVSTGPTAVTWAAGPKR